MFKKILFKITTILGRIYSRFNTAFNEVYSEKKPAIEFSSEIKKRKKANKEEAIHSIACFTMFNAYVQDRKIIPYRLAKEFAKAVFEKEKARGNIDEFNNPIFDKEEGLDDE